MSAESKTDIELKIYDKICSLLMCPPRECLDLDDRGMGPIGALALTRALIDNTYLTSVELGYNDFGTEFIVDLSIVLAAIPTLKVVDISGNRIGDAENGQLAIEAVETLLKNTSIETLDIAHNEIGSVAAVEIMRIVCIDGCRISTLTLSRNKIDSPAIASIAGMLETNTTLTSLNIGRNAIGQTGAFAIANALRVNQSLSYLNLGMGDIGPAGAEALWDSLSTNNTITMLNLCANAIGDRGASAAASSLSTNVAITMLNLSANGIGTAGVMALADTLRYNSTITSLDLGQHTFGPIGCDYFVAAFDTNCSLIELYLMPCSDEQQAKIDTICARNSDFLAFGIGLK